MIDGRRYLLKVPAGYEPSRPLPLVIAIHGYGATPESLESYFGLDEVADARGFFVAYPEGTLDQARHRFFNASDACCDFYGTGVDDVGFLRSMLDELEASYAIDPARVFVVGHSNGGFMAYRLACDLSSRIAAIVSVSGAMSRDASRCRPASPVAVLEVHGSDDFTILPEGGVEVDGYSGMFYPSVVDTVMDWVKLDGLRPIPAPGPDPGFIASDATGGVHSEQWGPRGEVALWLLLHGGHGPLFTREWPEAAYDFLAAHPKAE